MPHELLDGHRIRACHEQKACGGVAQVMEAQLTHPRDGPELAPIYRATA